MRWATAAVLQLAVVASLAGLTGCASQATHLHSDMAAADNLCPQHSFRTTTDRMRCYAANERPVVAKDLPGALYSYDAFRSATVAAAKNYNDKITFANHEAAAAVDAAENENGKRFSAAVAPFWPQDQKEVAALRDKVKDARASACMKDGFSLSPTLGADYTCQRSADLRIIEKEVPAAFEAEREYWYRMLEAAAVRDQSVAPVIQKASADFTQAIAPAKAAYSSDVQTALRADAAATAQQQQEISDLLGVALAGFAAGYAAPAVSRPVFVSCTQLANVANCIGQ